MNEGGSLLESSQDFQDSRCIRDVYFHLDLGLLNLDPGSDHPLSSEHARLDMYIYLAPTLPFPTIETPASYSNSIDFVIVYLVSEIHTTGFTLHTYHTYL